MTDLQSKLGTYLADNFKAIKFAKFDGNTLTIRAETNFKRKISRHSAQLAFDDAATLSGPAVDQLSYVGKWADVYARAAFFGSLLIGQGEESALAFAKECMGTVGSGMIGCTQSWLDSHRDALNAAKPVAAQD